MAKPMFLWAFTAGLALSIPTQAALSQDSQETLSVEPATFVRTITLDPASDRATRRFFGRVAALETVDLSFEVPGYLEVLNAPEGYRVVEGTLIASLDLGPFERAVERAELALGQAQRDLERSRTLAQRRVVSEVQARDAQTERDLADVALREAREALEDARIVAPFDGLIAERIASSYTTVAPGRPIVRVHNLSEVRVEFNLPERILAQIGDPSQVSFSTVLPGMTSVTELVFREIEADTGSVGQSYTISLAVAGPLPKHLLPGKTVIVTAALRAGDDAVDVPASAIATRPDGTPIVVAVEEDDGVLVARHVPVQVHSSTGTGLSITGLAPGTEIVEIGAHLIAPEQKLARYTGLIVEGR